MTGENKLEQALATNFQRHCYQQDIEALKNTVERLRVQGVNGEELADFLNNHYLLHHAVSVQFYEAVEYFLSLGSSPIYSDTHGYTPMHFAIMNIDLDILSRLVENHEKTNSHRLERIRNPSGDNLLHACSLIATNNKILDIASYLIHKSLQLILGINQAGVDPQMPAFQSGNYRLAEAMNAALIQMVMSHKEELSFVKKQLTDKINLVEQFESQFNYLRKHYREASDEVTYRKIEKAKLLDDIKKRMNK